MAKKTKTASTSAGERPVSNNLQTALKNATQKLAKSLEDATELKVETRYVLLSGADTNTGPDETGRLLARTVMQLDGDATVILPMTRSDTGELQTNKEIFDLHQSNVTTALKYRMDLLTNLMAALRSLG